MAETNSETKSAIPLKRSQFVCPKCQGEDKQGAFFFFAPAEDIRTNESGDYVADCPQCGVECAELWYMRNVRLCAGKQTGPTSEAGKNKVRMNGYKTGSSYLSGAIPKVLPPAKPGKYAECESCNDREDCDQEVKDAAGTCRTVICHRQSEVFAKYRAAHLSGDPESLRMIAADTHARMHLVMNACFKAVFEEGIYIEQPIYEYDPISKKRVIIGYEKRINPAINESIKILEKMGFSLSDWTLTPKSKEAKAALEGYLAGKAAAEGKPIDEFIAEHNQHMKDFQKAIAKGSAAAQQDETLMETQAEEAETQEEKPLDSR